MKKLTQVIKRTYTNIECAQAALIAVKTLGLMAKVLVSGEAVDEHGTPMDVDGMMGLKQLADLDCRSSFALYLTRSDGSYSKSSGWTLVDEATLAITVIGEEMR